MTKWFFSIFLSISFVYLLIMLIGFRQDTQDYSFAPSDLYKSIQLANEDLGSLPSFIEIYQQISTYFIQVEDTYERLFYFEIPEDEDISFTDIFNNKSPLKKYSTGYYAWLWLKNSVKKVWNTTADLLGNIYSLFSFLISLFIFIFLYISFLFRFLNVFFKLLFGGYVIPLNVV